MPRRVLQYNIHASTQFHEHEICWEVNNDDASIREWISAILPDDTIQIIPKAQFPAWINYVREAEMEVHGTQRPIDILMTDAPLARNDVEFSYQDLDESSDEIRLIKLNPGTGDQSISCSLMHTSLNDLRLPYEALSYCWGDPRNRQDIFLHLSETDKISKSTLSIASNLYSALKSLRPQSGPPRLFWIDAVSINQLDLDERSKQVARMREIYHRSSRVVVWLGDGNEDTKASIKTIRAISERHERNKIHEFQGDELISLHEPLMNKDENGVSDFIDRWQVLESPWFRRTWVVQEVFNAGEVLVHCGEDTLTWPMLLRTNQCIRLSGALKMTNSYKALLPPIYESIFNSRILSGADSHSSTTLGILEILVAGLDLDATDPRDKIFAMLPFRAEMDTLPAELIPNYHKPVAVVFSDFTRWWVMEHQSLRILSAIQALEGRTWLSNSWDKNRVLITPDQPSWSWSYRGQSRWALGILGLSTKDSYHACGTTKLDINLLNTSLSSPLLPLAGYKIDTISTITPYPYFQPPANHEALHRAYVSIFDPLSLTGKWLHQMGSKNDDTYTMDDNRQLMSEHYYAHLEYASRTAAVECHDKCFFRTREKGTLGLCPFGAREGDLVVVLKGGDVPYVIRECAAGDGSEEVRYEFIGECYLEGYMFGFAVEEGEAQRLRVEIFILGNSRTAGIL